MIEDNLLNNINMNKTRLLSEIHKDYWKDSLQEIIKNRDYFGDHSVYLQYMLKGPLRECRTIHLNGNKNPGEIERSGTGDRQLLLKQEFFKTQYFIQHLKEIIDPDNIRAYGRSYITILEPGKKIYRHSDRSTKTNYWDMIDRYQFYYSADEHVMQEIGGELFPPRPGYLFLFDHQCEHYYENNGSADMVLLVFDLLKQY